MRRWTVKTAWAWIAGLFLAAGLAAQTPGFSVSDEDLGRWVAEALPLVRSELGVELEAVQVRVAGEDEVRRALEQENRALMGRLLGDEGAGRRSAESFARALAPNLLAKYVFDEGIVYVQPQVFARFEDFLGLADFATPETLRGVLLHELVHAADDERFDLQAVFDGCPTQDAVLAYNHVIEGHAQLVTRRLAPELGWAAGFERYVTALTTPPKSVSQKEGEGGSAHLLRMAALQTGQLYTEGERFMSALAAEGGDEALTRALKSPPTDTAMIAHPRWFLHPEERPANLYDLNALLDRVAEGLDEDEWGRQRIAVPSAALAASLAPLTAEEVEPIVSELRQNLVLAAAPPGQPQRQVLVALLEFSTPAAAEGYLRAMRTMQERRDEQWKQGGVRIEHADYQTLEPPAPPGFGAEKRVIANGLVSDVTCLYTLQGSLALEMVSVSVPDWDTEHLTEVALEVLEGAREALRQPAAAPTPR